MHRVVIVGGGFGGLHAARSLARTPVHVTLVDKRNFHLFQPLLYQVATGGLSPANIAAPLRSILRRQSNCEVLLGEAIGFSPGERRLLLADGSLSYDTLIVAGGARYSYFGHDEWARWAPGLKTIEQATDIRRRILSAFERAEREPDPDARRAWLTFVIVGAGPTGVELAGALAEIARHTLRRDFRHIDPSDASILVLDASPHLLGVYPEDLRCAARKALEGLHVRVQTGTAVTSVASDAVVVSRGGVAETIPTRTVLWAAGVQASELAASLSAATGARTDRAGRVEVANDLSLSGHPEIFAIGDMVSCPGPDGRPLPGVAPVAIQQGRYVARLIAARLQGRSEPPFRYRGRGSMATIGRSSAIAQLGRFHLHGFLAWLLWLFVHLMQLVQFENRLLVMVQWGWSYLTHNRTARLITTSFEESTTRTSSAPPE